MPAGIATVMCPATFARPTVEFMPGAFAYHLHSYSATTIRSTTKNWVGPLLAKGATATMGCVEEPYLYGTPDMAVFFARWVGGFTYGEAAYAGQTSLSWMVTVVGDPLYRPFGRSLPEERQDLERRHSPLLPWLYLNLVNLPPPPRRISRAGHRRAWTNCPLTKQSAGVLHGKTGRTVLPAKPAGRLGRGAATGP